LDTQAAKQKAEKQKVDSGARVLEHDGKALPSVPTLGQPNLAPWDLLSLYCRLMLPTVRVRCFAGAGLRVGSIFRTVVEEADQILDGYS